MQKSRKKFWIIFSCVLSAVIVLCSVFALATRLKTVTVEFRTRLAKDETVLESGILNKVKNSGEFDFGKSILFMNFDEAIEKIEKSNPYIKVEQVVRHFPNVARVYVSERIPMYRIMDANNDDKWYILDKDFKIVDVVTGDLKQINYGSSSYYDKTVEISPDSITLISYVGAFVNDDVDKNFLNIIARGIKSRTDDLAVTKSIKIEKNEGNFRFTITMKNSGLNDDNGCEIVVEGKSKLEEKVLAGICCFCENTENQSTFDLSSKRIIIETIDGEFIGRLQSK